MQLPCYGSVIFLHTSTLCEINSLSMELRKLPSSCIKVRVKKIYYAWRQISRENARHRSWVMRGHFLAFVSSIFISFIILFLFIHRYNIHPAVVVAFAIGTATVTGGGWGRSWSLMSKMMMMVSKMTMERPCAVGVQCSPP